MPENVFGVVSEWIVFPKPPIDRDAQCVERPPVATTRFRSTFFPEGILVQWLGENRFQILSRFDAVFTIENLGFIQPNESAENRKPEGGNAGSYQPEARVAIPGDGITSVHVEASETRCLQTRQLAKESVPFLTGNNCWYFDADDDVQGPTLRSVPALPESSVQEPHSSCWCA